MLCNARKTPINDIESRNIFDLPLNQYATTYSTGMKKKLALTAILLQRNEYFILDEPFNGVDIESNMLLTEIIHTLKKLGKTVIISSHIFSTLSDTCDEINLLSEGSIKPPPISIIYDEIDAHVGGRAAVTMAKLLADQSRKNRSRDYGIPTDIGSQIIAITHSASLAAIADRHIVVERCYRSGSQSSPVRTYVADGSSRRKEIARMASGDLASDEAETFADALIRDALLQRSMSTS